MAKKEMEARYEEAKAEQEKQSGSKAETVENGGEGGGEGKMGNNSKAEKASQAKKPLDEYQYNFTDPESRIMKAGNGKHCEQSYNAQAAVDTESMLVVGKYVTNHPNDKQELVGIINSVEQGVYTPETVSADTGFFSEGAIKAVEQEDEAGKRQGPEVFCAVERQSHHRSVKDLEKKEEVEPPPVHAPVKEKMAQKLKTPRGKAVYKERKEPVESVFGIIKRAMGFRLRGLERVGIEWDLVTLAYDIKRLFSLSGGRGLPFLPNWG